MFQEPATMSGLSIWFLWPGGVTCLPSHFLPPEWALNSTFLPSHISILDGSFRLCLCSFSKHFWRISIIIIQSSKTNFQGGILTCLCAHSFKYALESVWLCVVYVMVINVMLFNVSFLHAFTFQTWLMENKIMTLMAWRAHHGIYAFGGLPCFHVSSSSCAPWPDERECGAEQQGSSLQAGWPSLALPVCWQLLAFCFPSSVSIN